VQDKAVHGHILAVDTHINFSVEEDYGEELEEMTSISLVEQAPVGQAHPVGVRLNVSTPLGYKRESALVRRQGFRHTRT
jgi:hypothetical protein